MQEISTDKFNKEEIVLKVNKLKTQFFVYDGIVKAIEDVSLTLHKGEVLGIVGETGCGKSVTAYSITKLIPDPPGRIVSGQIFLGNLNILRNIDKEAKIFTNRKRVKIKRNTRLIKRNELFFNQIRGKYISMIFQEPMAALNPVYTIEDQIIETLVLHKRSYILEVAQGAAKNINKLIKFRQTMEEDQDINPEKVADLREYKPDIEKDFEGPLKEELFKLADSNKGTASFLKHLDLLIEEGNIYNKKPQKYDRILNLDKQMDNLRVELLKEKDEIKVNSMEKKLANYSKKINLIKLSKQLKRNKKDPIILEARRESFGLLETVNIADAYGILKRYPHELSGGMLQRVVISIALANEPEILIADEPTTALDVTVQAQILEIMRQLQKNRGTSIILITHDLGVIAEMCDRVAVMYAGNIVEVGSVNEVFHNPKHPYTIGLLSSIPRIDNPDKKLRSIPGTVPNLINPPTGCRFNPRCPMAFEKCKIDVPLHIEVSPNHIVACHLFNGTEVSDY